jgi:hypothetical protein
MSLPIPKNINFKMPKTTEQEFFNASAQGWDEDADLLKTGEWDNYEENSEE